MTISFRPRAAILSLLLGHALIPAVAADDASPGFALPPIESMSEIVARPLFMPTRRPVSAPSVATPPPRLAIAGVIISGERRTAILDTGSGAAAPYLRVTAGDVVAGWTVASVEADRVILRNGAARVELTLKDNAPPYRAPPIAAR